jgi:predicted NBD/HSP70 family sugar kinase
MAPNLGWQNVPIQNYLSERLSLPVTVENNVRAMALGEAIFGSAQQLRVMAFVYARYGVGAGFVVDGKLFRGSGAGAGEIGHIATTYDGGILCRCGNLGCLETLVSEPSILAEAKKIARNDRGSELAKHLSATQKAIY